MYVKYVRRNQRENRMFYKFSKLNRTTYFLIQLKVKLVASGFQETVH